MPLACSVYITATTTAPSTTVTRTTFSAVGSGIITPGPDPPPYHRYFKRELDGANDLAERDLEHAVAPHDAGVELAKRGGSIPAYAASGCANSASRYSSACSCIGVTDGSTSPTYTITSTITTTSYATTRTAAPTTIGGTTPPCSPKWKVERRRADCFHSLRPSEQLWH